jgi:hypothetical protein
VVVEVVAQIKLLAQMAVLEAARLTRQQALALVIRHQQHLHRGIMGDKVIVLMEVVAVVALQLLAPTARRLLAVMAVMDQHLLYLVLL